jgi:hypothetical protein
MHSRMITAELERRVRRAKLSGLAERVVRRLVAEVDDFGQYTADPQALRRALFGAEEDKHRNADIERALDELVRAGLCSRYGGNVSPPESASSPIPRGRDGNGDDGTLREESYLQIVGFGQELRKYRAQWPMSPASRREDEARAGGKKVPPDTPLSEEGRKEGTRARGPRQAAPAPNLPMNDAQRLRVIKELEAELERGGERVRRGDGSWGPSEEAVKRLAAVRAKLGRLRDELHGV